VRLARHFLEPGDRRGPRPEPTQAEHRWSTAPRRSGASIAGGISGWSILQREHQTFGSEEQFGSILPRDKLGPIIQLSDVGLEREREARLCTRFPRLACPGVGRLLRLAGRLVIWLSCPKDHRAEEQPRNCRRRTREKPHGNRLQRGPQIVHRGCRKAVSTGL